MVSSSNIMMYCYLLCIYCCFYLCSGENNEMFEKYFEECRYFFVECLNKFCKERY